MKAIVEVIPSTQKCVCNACGSKASHTIHIGCKQDDVFTGVCVHVCPCCLAQLHYEVHAADFDSNNILW